MDMGAGLFLHSGLVSAALLMDDVPVFICICTFLIAGNLFHSGLIPTILIVDMVAGPALHGFYIAAVRRVRRVVLTQSAGIGSGLRRRAMPAASDGASRLTHSSAASHLRCFLGLFRTLFPIFCISLHLLCM